MLNADPSSRVRFIKGRQREFLEAALLGLRLRNLAKTAGVCDRTLRDWKREKYNIDYGSLKRICLSMDTEMPRDIEILQSHWSVKKASRLGGKRRFELYGAPGTLESRRRGGAELPKEIPPYP
ncbi:MAG: hypothetical protein ISS26_04665 [Candidatus Omnitrophica bacterium]|nr:hypothetical protein [Candidatus Omnitrophota bacterium]